MSARWQTVQRERAALLSAEWEIAEARKAAMSAARKIDRADPEARARLMFAVDALDEARARLMFAVDALDEAHDAITGTAYAREQEARSSGPAAALPWRQRRS